MTGFIEGEDRNQATLFPGRLDDYVAEENQVRVIDVFIIDLDILRSRTQDSSERHRPTGLPFRHDGEDLCARLRQSRAVESSSETRSAA